MVQSLLKVKFLEYAHRNIQARIIAKMMILIYSKNTSKSKKQFSELT
jgi:hypothetical protein